MAERTAQHIDSPAGEPALKFRLLGPIEVSDGDGRILDIGGSKPRLVLVQLLQMLGDRIVTRYKRR